MKSLSSKYSSKHSKSSISSSSRESTSCKETETDLLAIQAKERFDRKKELIEKKKKQRNWIRKRKHLVKAQNKLHVIRLPESFEEGSISSGNSRD